MDKILVRIRTFPVDDENDLMQSEDRKFLSCQNKNFIKSKRINKLYLLELI